MKKTFSALAFLALAFSLAAAVSQTSQSFTSKSSEVDKLVDVQTDFSLEKLVPGGEYKSSAFISFAIPPASLTNFNSGHVIVHVRVKGLRDGSWVFFKGLDGSSANRYNAVFFDLECVVKQGACDERVSTLSRQLPVFYLAPMGGSQALPVPSAAEQREDGVVVDASLEPFPQQQSLIDAARQFALLQNTQSPAAQLAGALVRAAQESGGDDGAAAKAVSQALGQEGPKTPLEGDSTASSQAIQVGSGAGEATPAGLGDASRGKALSLSGAFSGLAVMVQDSWPLGIAVLCLGVVGAWHLKKGRRKLDGY